MGPNQHILPIEAGFGFDGIVDAYHIQAVRMIPQVQYFFIFMFCIIDRCSGCRSCLSRHKHRFDSLFVFIVAFSIALVITTIVTILNDNLRLILVITLLIFNVIVDIFDHHVIILDIFHSCNFVT